MTTPIFLATLGQRPEAITVALDILDARYHYKQVGIIHTDHRYSGITQAYEQLSTVIEQDYPTLDLIYHEITDLDDRPLIDITDTHTAEVYYSGLVRLLREYRIRHQPIHLLVASGRKAMSIYATLATTLLFGEHDIVWTVLTQSKWMQEGLFHLPPEAQETVELVEIPSPISRLIPGEIARKTVAELTQRVSPRQLFLETLTRSERRLTETLTQHMYVSNEKLAELLNKTPKTVENQLGHIYSKLFAIFDLKIHDKRKRQVLIDILQGKV